MSKLLLDDVRTKLFEIDEQKFVEVVQLLERARELGDVEEAFKAIRPRLVQLRPARRLNLKRIFCEPFEDLFDYTYDDLGVYRRVERGCISPLWEAVEAYIEPDVLPEMVKRVRDQPSTAVAVRREVGAKLLPLAAAALGRALIAQTPGRKGYRLGNDVYDVAAVVRDILECAAPINEIRNMLPHKPVERLDQEGAAALRHKIKVMIGQGAVKTYYFVLIIASRMRNPGDIISIISDIDFSEVSSPDSDLFSDITASILSAASRRIQRTERNAESRRDPLAVADAVLGLVEQLQVASEALGRKRNKQFDGRMDALANSARTMVRGRILREGGTQITDAVAALVNVGHGQAAVDRDSVAAAEDHARAMRICNRVAGAIGVQREVTASMSQLAESIEGKASRYLRELKGGGFNPESLAAAIEAISYCLRLLEIVADSGRAARLQGQFTEILAGL